MSLSSTCQTEKSEDKGPVGGITESKTMSTHRILYCVSLTNSKGCPCTNSAPPFGQNVRIAPQRESEKKSKTCQCGVQFSQRSMVQFYPMHDISFHQSPRIRLPQV